MWSTCGKSMFNVGYIQVIFILIGIFIIYNILEYVKEKVIQRQNPSRFVLTKHRRLSNIESTTDLLSLERQGAGNICLVVSLRSKTKLLKEYVQKALVLLAKRQPMLRAIVTTSADKEKYFEIIDGDEITGMIDLTSRDAKARQWQDVWHEVTSKQRGTGLLWKTVMLQEEFLSDRKCYANTLLFNFSHCALDGVSTMKFCQQFLYWLNGLADGSLTSDDDVPSLRLSPSFTDLATPQRPWSVWKVLTICLGIPRMPKLIFKTFLRLWLFHKQRNPFFAQLPPNLQPSRAPRTRMLSTVFSKTETSNIVQACRLNGCTVTGALMAAMHLAFCKLIRQRNVTKDVDLEHSYAINAQRHCQRKPPDDYMGHFALTHPFWIKYTFETEADFWELALEATKRIRCDVKEGQYVSRAITVSESYLSPEECINEIVSPEDKQKSIRMSNCNSVSNAGAFDLKPGQDNYIYSLHECLFNCIQHSLTSTFNGNVTTVNGKMAWIISYDQAKVTNDEQAEAFATFCFDYFVGIANEAVERD